jgi:hypothetical protein
VGVAPPRPSLVIGAPADTLRPRRAGMATRVRAPQVGARAEKSCLTPPARRIKQQMAVREPRHLRAVGTRRLATPRGCRTIGCALQRQGTLGFCAPCEAVYHAAVELRERLLAYRGAQLEAARPALFEHMAPELRQRLLAHVAAQGAHRGSHPSALELAGLEDFLSELRDLGLERLTWR